MFKNLEAELTRNGYTQKNNYLKVTLFNSSYKKSKVKYIYIS